MTTLTLSSNPHSAISQFAILIGAMLLALCYSASAQQPKKISRIGYLMGTESATDSPRPEAIRRGLRELGYIEGQNIAIDVPICRG